MLSLSVEPDCLRYRRGCALSWFGGLASPAQPTGQPANPPSAQMWTSIAQHISQVTHRPFTPQIQHPVSGGCINQGYKLTDREGQSYFVKLNQAQAWAMFEAEACALQQIAAAQAILVPKPIAWGIAGNSCYLVLDWLDLNAGRADRPAWTELGRQLARLHRLALSDRLGDAGGVAGGDAGSDAGGDRRFGWMRDNTIGATPQPNDWCENWAIFWQQKRLGFQIQLARRQGGQFPQADKLLAAVPELLADRHPEPSLLHGDLWSGNAAVLADGTPVIFDPASYYGDRETDLAMTELFGGFPAAFYEGYNAVWPLDAGYEWRKNLYNLYHVLNHFNLFGGGYLGQANRMIGQLL